MRIWHRSCKALFNMLQINEIKHFKMDGGIMTNRKNQISCVIFMIFCFLNFFASFSKAEVTLTIGKGSGIPGATESPVTVSLENQHQFRHQ